MDSSLISLVAPREIVTISDSGAIDLSSSACIGIEHCPLLYFVTNTLLNDRPGNSPLVLWRIKLRYPDVGNGLAECVVLP